MKKKDLAEIKNKKATELKAEANKLERELANARLEQSMGKLKNPHAIKEIKKSIAQVKTILRLKEIVDAPKEKQEKETKDEQK